MEEPEHPEQEPTPEVQPPPPVVPEQPPTVVPAPPPIQEQTNHLQFIPLQEAEFQKQRKQRQEYLKEQLLNKNLVPASYWSNSRYEETTLEFVANFKRQYAQLYPGRKELLLCPRNEFDITKFVCTTLRPTKLDYPELYEFRTCAKFIADHIDYQPLEIPYELPKILNSPTYTLKVQKGNCLDLSILLASYLKGAGYDAYVVSGYAEKKITTMDESKGNYTIQKFESITNMDTQSNNQSEEEKKDVNAKYKVKPIKPLQSAYLEKMKERERKRILEEQKKAKPKESKETNISSNETDEFRGLRVHFWVLILPGKREISEAFFIEPSTGKIYSCENENYLGVESIFNTNNYWVNVQTCYNGLNGISFDLKDNTKWEFVFLERPEHYLSQKDAEEDGNKDGVEENAEAPHIDPSNSYDGQPIIDVPKSWVNRLEISNSKFELRFPDGCKTILYQNAQVYRFAPYARPDGMVLRLNVFNEQDRSVVETQEFFENRKDKLCRRRQIGGLVYEVFDQGRYFGLREHITENGKTKELYFYPEARIDGLVKRIETPLKVTQTFTDRDDYLTYRSVKYQSEERYESFSENNIEKMTEKFDFNPNVSESPQKRRYLCLEEKMHVTFHLEPGRLFPSFRDFRKPSAEVKNIHKLCTYYDCDPYAKPLKPQQLFTKYQNIRAAESACFHSIKQADRETAELLQTRYQEEKNVQLSVSLYDTLHFEAKTAVPGIPTTVDEKTPVTTKLKEMDIKSYEVDYLTPFLINVTNPSLLTKEEALQVKDACLKSFKEHLLEKAQIIQQRNDQETALYQKRQQEYQAHQETMTMDDHDSFKKFCEETLFRIQILEKRLNKHKETAPERYIALDKKLKSDPRLSKLFQ